MQQILNQLHCRERQDTCQPRQSKSALKMKAVLPTMSQDHTSVSLWITLGWTPSLWSCACLGAAHPPHTKEAPQVPNMPEHNPGQFCLKMQSYGSAKPPNLPVEARSWCEHMQLPGNTPSVVTFLPLSAPKLLG